jgi:Sec-independent protein translocase protein TatA
MFGIPCFVLPSILGVSDFRFRLAFISPGSGEFLLIMLVLILLFGAKDAPRIFRSIHNALDKMQRAAASFRYKIMYGDLHQQTARDETYDVEADYADEKEKSSAPETPETKTEESTPGAET